MLHKENSKPLYIQLKEEIYKMLDCGEIRAGERIPSERELCDRNKISRMTVRLAIAEAIKEGRLYRQQGKGTYVAIPKVEQKLTRITTFENTMLTMGLKPETLIQSCRALPNDPYISGMLGLPAASDMINIRLMGLGSGEPMVLYSSYFEYEFGKSLVKKAEELAENKKAFSSLDLYDWDRGPFPSSVRQTLEAVEADEWISGLMKLKKGTTLMQITSIFHDKSGVPIEYRKASYRGDKYKFYVVRELYDDKF